MGMRVAMGAALGGKDPRKMNAGDFAKAAADPFDVVGKLGGTSKEAGYLGTGQFKAGQHEIDWNAFNEDEAGIARRGQIQGQLDGIQGRTAPTMSMDQQAQFRDEQLALANDLAARARGEGPSIAETSLRRTTDRNLAGAMAMANSGVGNPASVARTIGNQVASLNQEAAGQASALRLQEAENARMALGGVLQSGRGADIDIAGANLNADINNRQLNDQMTRGLNEQLLGSEKAFADRRVQGQQLGVQQQLGVNQVNASAFDSASKRRGDFTSKIGEGLAKIALSSDRRGKENIKPADGEIQDFLDALSAYTFDYKNKKHGAGKRVGVMAQDIEKTKTGDKIVKDTEEGKALDFANALGAMMASSGVLNDRMNELEKAFEMDHGRKSKKSA